MQQKVTEEGEEVAEKIKQTFLKNIHKLETRKKSHFMIRLYRTTKNPKYIPQSAENFLNEKDNIIKDIQNFNNKTHITKRSNKYFNRFEKLKEISGEREVKRQQVFKNKKSYLFYFELLENLYFWKSLQVIKIEPFKPHYKKALHHFKKLALKKYFLDREIIKYYGTHCVNYIYYLKFMGLADLMQSFKKIFYEIFRKKSPRGYMYLNKIYGLTHFILADSDYYQKFTSEKKFSRVLDYFRKNLQEILKKTNPDIISEVGLCFKLCKTTSGKEIEQITRHLVKTYNKKLGYIPRKNLTDMNLLEHRNSVAYLFLCNFKRLYKGPDISRHIVRFKRM